MNLPKHIHVIGICGVATSALAIAFKNAGVRVTGSDKGFFPPVSTELEKNGIDFYAGWHPENMVAGGAPDLVMIGGGGTSPSNPETVYAREHGIPACSYAEALQRYFIKKNSIVVAGTWGKTTASSLLSYILIQAGLDPSYFTGGLSLSHPTGALVDSDWSVVEGDEYQVSISDRRPKFVYYAPTHLLLTSVSWDHADLYPTEKDYFAAFDKLVAGIPVNGLIVACTDNAGVNQLLTSASIATKKAVVSYGQNESADYRLHDIAQSKDGLSFTITHEGKDYAIKSPMLGRFNAENMAGCFAMACEIGIPAEKIIAAIGSFKGIKRRFEKRLEGGSRGIIVFDCHAPTPEKAAAVLKELHEIYGRAGAKSAGGQIIAVYEPNIGGRERASIAKYDDAFKDADFVLIPRLTKLKVAEDSSGQPMEGAELATTIKKTHSHSQLLEDDEALVSTLVSETKKGDVIVFLGSHGWRGMIEAAVRKLI